MTAPLVNKLLSGSPMPAASCQRPAANDQLSASYSALSEKLCTNAVSVSHIDALFRNKIHSSFGSLLRFACTLSSFVCDVAATSSRLFTPHSSPFAFFIRPPCYLPVYATIIIFESTRYLVCSSPATSPHIAFFATPPLWKRPRPRRHKQPSRLSCLLSAFHHLPTLCLLCHQWPPETVAE